MNTQLYNANEQRIGNSNIKLVQNNISPKESVMNSKVLFQDVSSNKIIKKCNKNISSS